MFSFLQIIIISILFGFIIHQIISFLSKPAPKIKYTEIEKYKSLLENAAISAAAAATPPSCMKNTASPPLPPSLIEITDEIDVTMCQDEDNESVYSAGYTELKNEMEDDLLRAVLEASASS